MKEKLSIFYNYLKTHLTYRDLIIALLAVLCIGLSISYRYYYKKSLTPIVVYNTDSLEVYKNKIKEEYVSKDIYVLDVKNLKKQNNELSEELKNLKDNPIVITKSDIQVRIDTVVTKSDSIVKSDSIYNLAWHIDEPEGYYSIAGNTFVHQNFSVFKTLLTKFNLTGTLTLDILDNTDNKLRLVGKFDNPYVTITNMDGVVFDPTDSKLLKKYYKQKKWSIGPMVGYGLTSDFKFRPFIGVGVSYGFILF